MIKRQIAFHSTEIEEVYTLYQQAFPKNEQMDLTRLFDELHLGAIYGYYQENQLVGFAILCILTVVLILFIVAMPKFKKLQVLIDKINLVAREILTGLPVIRAFNKEKSEEERFDKANLDLTKVNIFVNRVMSFMMPLLMFLMNGISLMIVFCFRFNVYN